MKPGNVYLAVGTVSAAATFGALTLLHALGAKLAPAPPARAPEHDRAPGHDTGLEHDSAPEHGSEPGHSSEPEHSSDSANHRKSGRGGEHRTPAPGRAGSGARRLPVR